MHALIITVMGDERMASQQRAGINFGPFQLPPCPILFKLFPFTFYDNEVTINDTTRKIGSAIFRDIQWLAIKTKSLQTAAAAYDSVFRAPDSNKKAK